MSSRAGRKPGRDWNGTGQYELLDTIPTMVHLPRKQREWLQSGAESMSSVVRRLIEAAMSQEESLENGDK